MTSQLKNMFSGSKNKKTKLTRNVFEDLNNIVNMRKYYTSIRIITNNIL